MRADSPRFAERLRLGKIAIWAVCGLGCGRMVCEGTARAGVATDGSLGARSTLSGPQYNIPASLGKQVGSNLFQSFSAFNLSKGETANFTGPAGIKNVLSRVTGGGSSSIDGTIHSSIPGANLFLLNPRGVLFGPNASVDVDGAFTVSTGPSIRLADGSQFNAVPGVADSTLTSAAPVAYGFLASGAGPIDVNGSQLQAGAGATLSFYGGDVTMENGASVNASGIVIRGGRLAMNNSQVNVSADRTHRAVVRIDRGISLANQSVLQATTSADASGADVMDLAAGGLTMTGGSTISSVTNDAHGAGDIRISAGEIAMTGGSSINTSSNDVGAGGNVWVRGGDLYVSDLGSGIISNGNGDGPCGNITLSLTGKLSIVAGGTVQTTSYGAGRGGDIVVSAGAVSVVGSQLQFTNLSADAQGSGNGGSVKLTIAGPLVIANAAQVSADTYGTGNGGDVTIQATEAIVDGQGSSGFTGLSTTTQSSLGGGAGGNIALHTAGLVTLLGGGEISAATFGSGAGGNVSVGSSAFVTSGKGQSQGTGIFASSSNAAVGGPGGAIFLVAPGALTIADAAQISASTSGPGRGGVINISTGTLTVTGSGSLVTAATSLPVNGGAGGDINIFAGSCVCERGGAISASTAGSGAGGSINITTDRLLVNGGSISADTSAPRFAMPLSTVENLTVTLNMNATNDQNVSVSLIGPDATTVVSLFGGVGGNGQNFHGTTFSDSAATSIGDPSATAPFTGVYQPQTPLSTFKGLAANGTWTLNVTDPVTTDSVNLTAWSLQLGGFHFASSDVPKALPGPEGSINNLSSLQVQLPLPRPVMIQPGMGGDVRVTAGVVELKNGGTVTARTLAGGAGNSGSIAVRSGSVNLDGGSSLQAANAGIGNSGSVSVRAEGDLNISGGSSVSTASLHGNAGVVTLRADDTLTVQDGVVSASAGLDGGSVELYASKGMQLNGSTISATAGTVRSASGAGGAGGDITIDPLYIVLDHTQISADAPVGRGGNILVRADNFLPNDSLLTATGTTAGTIEIAAPELDLAASLVALPASLLDASAQLRETCARRLGADYSSFLVIGSGGVAPAPDEMQQSVGDVKKRALH